MPHLLIVERSDRPEQTPESEGLLVDLDTPGVVRLVLDDGTELVAKRDAWDEAMGAAA